LPEKNESQDKTWPDSLVYLAKSEKRETGTSGFETRGENSAVFRMAGIFHIIPDFPPCWTFRSMT
jgi:hypothetical protein